jgi:hypothetical protein
VTTDAAATDDRLPPKLRERMERLMADLAALDEPELYVPTSDELVEVSTEEAEPDAADLREAAPSQGLAPTHLRIVPAPTDFADEPHADEPVTTEPVTTEPVTNEPLDDPAFAVGGREIDRDPPSDGPAALAPGRGSSATAADDHSGVDETSLRASVTASFSQQAREVLEILKRRQEQLAFQKNELELREAAIEKQLRQERLALVEKQRQWEAQASDWKTNSGPVPSAASTASAESDAAPAENLVAAVPRKITPEWIAVHERKAGGISATRSQSEIHAVPQPVAQAVAQAGVQAVAQPATPVSDTTDSAAAAAAANPPATLEATADSRVGIVLRESAQMTDPTSRALGQPTSVDAAADGDAREAALHFPSTPQAPRLREQAEQLRRQHESAIKAMQQTRRQLELLKDIVVQQQQQWATKTESLEQDRSHWEQSRQGLVEQWQQGLDEQQRLRHIEQNEVSKRETFLEQREAAVRAMEERLQQSQVEVLRDRVVLKQLERTIRQSLSNADWNQRWQIISEETQAYLKKVQQESELLRTQAKRQVERLESRRSELLMYRESLRRWIERQMKLICRRAAHSEEMETTLQRQTREIGEERRRLTAQQAALNETLDGGLKSVDERLRTHRAMLRA